VGCQAPAEEADRWQAGIAWTGFDTEISFDGEPPVELRQHALSASATRMLAHGWSLRAAAGATLGGALDGQALGPGWQVALQGGKLWRAADGPAPFVATTLALAAARSSGAAGTLLATDLRLGAAAGWQVGTVWSPYLAVQVYGAPVFLAAGGAVVRGADPHHLRPSIGSAFFLGEHLSAFADLAPVGERGVSGGAVWSW